MTYSISQHSAAASHWDVAWFRINLNENRKLLVKYVSHTEEKTKIDIYSVIIVMAASIDNY